MVILSKNFGYDSISYMLSRFFNYPVFYKKELHISFDILLFKSFIEGNRSWGNYSFTIFSLSLTFNQYLRSRLYKWTVCLIYLLVTSRLCQMRF